MQKNKKYITMGMVFLILFLFIYFILDYLNSPYETMAHEFGLYLVITNIILNIIMSVMGALMMNIGTAQVELKAGDGKASNLGFFSVLFGIFTYGCTSCVISFFAAIGIPFMVVALPLAGLPYKLISLLLLIIGFMWLLHRVRHSSCKIR